MPAITVIGEALVDLFAEPGSTLATSRQFTPRYGGAPANLAVSSAKLGGDVGFIGRVGKDGFGDGAIAALQGAGVDTSHMMRDPDQATMLACVALPTPDTPEFLLLPGANTGLQPDDIPVEALADTRVFAFGSVTLAYASRDAAIAGATRARDDGAEVVFDVNLRPNVWPSLDIARQQTKTAIALATVVKLNIEECDFLFGERDARRAADRLLAGGAALVCISDGANGSHFFTASYDAAHPSFAVNTVDATGAGDAFLAAVVVSLCEQELPVTELPKSQLASMAAFSNAAGALVSTKLGAMDAVFTRDDVEALAAGTSP